MMDYLYGAGGLGVVGLFVYLLFANSKKHSLDKERAKTDNVVATNNGKIDVIDIILSGEEKTRKDAEDKANEEKQKVTDDDIINYFTKRNN